MSIRSYTCSSYLTHFLPIRQEFVFFTKGGWKGFGTPLLGHCSYKVVYYFSKIWW